MPDGRVTCLMCGKILSAEQSAYRHYKLFHIANIPVKCPVCKKVFKNKVSQETHTRRFHNLSAYAMKNTLKPPSEPL